MSGGTGTTDTLPKLRLISGGSRWRKPGRRRGRTARKTKSPPLPPGRGLPSLRRTATPPKVIEIRFLYAFAAAPSASLSERFGGIFLRSYVYIAGPHAA